MAPVPGGVSDGLATTRTLSEDQPEAFDPRRSSLQGPPRLGPGDVLEGRFLIVRFLARGGMGEVYEAEDRLLEGLRVAIKTILPEIAAEPGAQKRFQKEVLLARQVTIRTFARSTICAALLTAPVSW